MISPERKSEGDSGDSLQGWVCPSSTGVSMQELEACDLPRESLKKLVKSLRITIMCLSSLLEKMNTLGRTILPAWVSAKSEKTNTNSHSPPIWGTYIRWMALCPEAWRIVIDGRIPLALSTPKIVEECGKKQHERLLATVIRYLEKLLGTRVVKDYKVEYSVKIFDEWRDLVLKPDAYKIWITSRGPVNLVVEVTTRSKTMIPREWLTSYNLGLYLQNLRPTFTLLVTPEEVGILPLSTKDVERLKNLLYCPPKVKPTPWLCSNCDLRPVCGNPLA